MAPTGVSLPEPNDGQLVSFTFHVRYNHLSYSGGLSRALLLIGFSPDAAGNERSASCAAAVSTGLAANAAATLAKPLAKAFGCRRREKAWRKLTLECEVRLEGGPD